MTNIKSPLINPIPIADGGTSASTAIGARAALGITIGARDIVGTVNQINVADGDGALGNPTISLATDTVIPGTGAVTVPLGQTIEQPGIPVIGMMRGNSDTGLTETYSNGLWRPLGRDIIGTANQINVLDGDGIVGDPTLSIFDNPIIPGIEAMTPPVGGTADQPASPVVGMIRGNSDTGFAEIYSDGMWVPITLSPSQLTKNYLTGLTNTVSSTTDVSFSPGQATDSTNSQMVSSSVTYTKAINAAWAEGTPAGGFPTALTLSIDTVYYTFIIAKANGTTDFGFDTSLTATNLLADAAGDGYIYYRRIGSCRTQAASTDLETIYQLGDYFYYQTQRKDFTIAYVGVGITNSVVPLSIPPTISVAAKIIAVTLREGTGTSDSRVFAMPITTTGIADNYLTHTMESVNGTTISEGVSIYDIPSDDGTIRFYQNITGGAGTGNSYVSTLGWIDTRDK